MQRGPGFWTQGLAPLPALDTVARVVAASPGSCLFASAGKVGRRSRYTFAAFDPFLRIRGVAGGARLEWRTEAPPGVPGDGFREGSDPIPLLQSLLDAFTVPASPAHPPFTGGLAGWFGYDMGRAFERVPERVADPLGLPAFSLGCFDLVLAIDHLTRKATLISTGHPQRHEAGRERRARERIDWLREALRAEGERAAPRGVAPAADAEIESNFTRDAYLDAIRRVKNYIRAGDIFQANVTQRLRWRPRLEPTDWFLSLVERNPVAFAAYIPGEDYDVISLSPERFLRVSGEHIETSPIKGTRPRGADKASDEMNARDLLASPKDRAELVMIVDLLRNDLGRVAESASVAVPELYSLESYSTVHHLVARVTARLRVAVTPLAALRAAFPGGSISGAPKIRAMEIIDEIEPHSRGLFMGSIGYVGANGEMDTSIAIRTVLVKNGVAYLQVGGGIVSDSRAEDEYRESLHKAAAIIGESAAERLGMEAPTRSAADG